MESITFGQCVKGAWRDGWRYFRHRPVFAVLLPLYAWLSSSVMNGLRPDSTPPFRLLTYVPLGVFALMDSALFALLVMHAIRFVLLDNDSPKAQPIPAPNYWRFLGCTWGLAMLAPLLVCLTLVPLCVAMALCVGLMIGLAHTAKIAIVLHPVEARILIAIVGAGVVLFAGGILFRAHAAEPAAHACRHRWHAQDTGSLDRYARALLEPLAHTVVRRTANARGLGPGGRLRTRVAAPRPRFAQHAQYVQRAHDRALRFRRALR
ncbi:hypothetical protein M3A49_08175 [Paraburkholderia sp. CNPSo 3076]|uniref:hypothetical protein n=1 Tax=Paraburkholderia sp. CNPSo 3076 TaxID=2940936 RepID=UPI0022549BB9|nr:hypothetical protein [Paraburkholderia sp. CNPSo 3076]MCX5539467.1 hypothetical protein [Paraburkholderia sp. CNPSo 3076]